MSKLQRYELFRPARVGIQVVFIEEAEAFPGDLLKELLEMADTDERLDRLQGERS